MPPRLPRLARIMNGGQPLTQPMPVRPPMMGWNTRDDLDGMDPLDAVQIDNWYADANGLNTRRGTQPYTTTPLAGAVQTLAEYYGASTRRLIAAGGGQIYDVTGGTPTSLASGFLSSKWTTVNFAMRLFLANGDDPVQVVYGGTLAAAGFTGPPSNPLGCFPFKGRLYFWCSESPVFWYGGIGNVTGPLQPFDLSTISQFGGNILTLCNFSHDGGDGITNTFCIIMDTGEVILYLGSDPGLTNDWNIVGKYKLAAPIGARSVCAYAGDVYLSTFDDHVALQEQLTALKVGQSPPRSKISGAVRNAMLANPLGFGYQAMYYGKGRRVIFNIPNIDATYDQHVYNTSNQSWQRFRGQNGSCWSEYLTNLYFGRDDGTVWQADTGSDDNGSPIVCVAQQAWNSLQAPTQKRLAGTRPVLQRISGQNYTFKVGFDYKNPVISITPQPALVAYSMWDTSIWDVALWSPEAAVTTPLVHAAAGTGTVLSVAMCVNAITPVIWMRTDLIFEISKQI